MMGGKRWVLGSKSLRAAARTDIAKGREPTHTHTHTQLGSSPPWCGGSPGDAGTARVVSPGGGSGDGLPGEQQGGGGNRFTTLQEAT
ncbi:hypothetical protein Hamer_G000227 [Homarus americanus]|uniref:Uncharacterized protein n=1 Tax=Homarus americanus TaxID=6706 RepID=A0A8J5NCY9_HOMAM|nr:hypothetical protein Hamer_G000227 [Homarus americanus]